MSFKKMVREANKPQRHFLRIHKIVDNVTIFLKIPKQMQAGCGVLRPLTKDFPSIPEI